MRHVRMLILCLVAVFAMGATTAVVASPAFASCNTECKEQKEKEKKEAKELKEKEKQEAKEQKEKEKEEAIKQKEKEHEEAIKQKEKEKAEAKKQKEKEEREAFLLKEKEKAEKARAKWEEKRLGDPYTKNSWIQFKNCPYENENINDCFVGLTNGGKTGGFFQYGKVEVKLSKSIEIQGGYEGAGSEILVFNPINGAKLLDSPEEPITGGLSVITPEIQEQAGWPEALQTAFQEAVANKETKASVIVEMAGEECTTVVGCLSTESLIFEEHVPPAFKLPLKVRVVSPFLEKLGGGPCQIGTDENPIKQNLWTGAAGRAGHIEFEKPNFEQTVAKNSQLVDLEWHIPVVSGANGCGGEYEAYVNKALNIALEVIDPFNGNEVKNRTGITVLTGTLHDGATGRVREEAEKGNL